MYYYLLQFKTFILLLILFNSISNFTKLIIVIANKIKYLKVITLII